jgi:salicylate hydroxylase
VLAGKGNVLDNDRVGVRGGKRLRIAIVGGGIGGLATALFLRRAGLDAMVFEQAPELREVGAGILVAPNAARLLRRLGLAEPLREVAVRLEVGWEFRRWEDGRVLFSQKLGDECERMYGEATYVVHRADLLDLLHRAVPNDMVNLGRRCVGVTQREDEVELAFEDGSVDRADVLVGADGIQSTVRNAIVTPQPYAFSGLSTYRCVIPADKAPEMARRPVQTLWLGPGRHFVHYPISAGRQVNVVAFVPANVETESWTAKGRVEDLAAEFAEWDERMQQIIAAATETNVWALYDREPLERWTVGRVTLLGDAAHPMFPFYAQGAGQAIEDAAILAGCLRDATRETAGAALLRYEEIRKPRATRVQRLSRGRQRHHHLPDGEEQRKRDAEFANEDPLGHNAWLYGHDVEAELAGGAGGKTNTPASPKTQTV